MVENKESFRKRKILLIGDKRNISPRLVSSLSRDADMGGLEFVSTDTTEEGMRLLDSLNKELAAVVSFHHNGAQEPYPIDILLYLAEKDLNIPTIIMTDRLEKYRWLDHYGVEVVKDEEIGFAKSYLTNSLRKAA